MKRKGENNDNRNRKKRKEQQIHQNHNKFLTDLLSELGNIEKNKGDRIRFQAYNKAVAVLKSHPVRITSGDEAKKLHGIGKKIGAKIQEIIDTGHLGRLERELNDEIVVALNEISQVSGIGPQMAHKLIHEYGIRSIEELKARDDIALTHHQQIGLQYFDEMQERIPRPEVKALFHRLRDVAKSIDSKIIVKCCGSYRRGLENSGDIDLLMTHPLFTLEQKQKGNTYDLLKRMVTKLHELKFLVEDISNGEYKYMGLCQLDKDHKFRHIDIKLFPLESFFTGLCHFTGSGEHNRQLRALALSKGMKLSEYGLYPVGETGVEGRTLAITCEKDIFDILGIDYLPPSMRSL
eukprot:TRINITY_DN2258_c0_g1_i1.p1 TRINITY_DN2258_c0_g1~~TRINITY_DN2258_c0_g1_i1.p1  ORF type:complete len:349 (+),score=76.96 TRINITY_DN2258_c0_g1_i1:213-1259(+)